MVATGFVLNSEDILLMYKYDNSDLTTRQHSSWFDNELHINFAWCIISQTSDVFAKDQYIIRLPCATNVINTLTTQRISTAMAFHRHVHFRLKKWMKMYSLYYEDRKIFHFRLKKCMTSDVFHILWRSQKI